MKIKCITTLARIALVLLPACTAGGIRSHQFLGQWEALSRNHMSISGDMTVERDRIIFSRKGQVPFEVLSFERGEYILRLSRVIDAGRVMRLGPISVVHDREQVQVAYYEDSKDAEAPREHRHSGSVSWGVYVR